MGAPWQPSWRATIIGHDIGTYAVRYDPDTERLVVMDAPVPGIPPWDVIVRDLRLGTGTCSCEPPVMTLPWDSHIHIALHAQWRDTLIVMPAHSKHARPASSSTAASF